jgi:CRISPR-associated protein Cas2
MSQAKHLVIFSYDVSRDSVRRKISKLLEEQGSRVQYSVFECRMTEAKGKLILRQLELVKDEHDSVRMYILDEFGRAASQQVGGAPISEKSEFWLL